MQNLTSRRRAIALSLAALFTLGSVAQDRQEFVFRHHTPMGGDALILLPSKTRLQLMATLESKELEGVRQIRYGQDEFLRDADGNPVRYYPQELTFRFSIGQKVAFLEKNPNPIETKDTPDEFQSNLRFQLKLFDGLKARVVEPEETKIIGVPKNIPYNERIYSVRFRLPRPVLADERLKLEVFDRNGTQIAKFQVQLL